MQTARGVKSHSATDGLSEVDETGHGGFGSRMLIDLEWLLCPLHPRALHSHPHRRYRLRRCVRGVAGAGLPIVGDGT